MLVAKADLGPLTFLAEGGFGRVFKAGQYRLSGDPASLAYKEFTVDPAGQVRSAQAAVAFRDGLPAADRAELDEYTTWPRALVADRAGGIRGLLMPLIPAEFFCRQRDPDSGQLTSKPRDMQWLIAREKQREAAQVDFGPVDQTERLLLLTHLVYIIGWLHKHGWVFGDVSFKNAVFTLGPPRLLLLDCDGAAALSDSGRKQSSTPMWDPPECPINPLPGQSNTHPLQDTVTDVYKLGLAVLRCVTPGKGAASSRSVSRLTGEFDAAGAGLVARALSADRASRPTAKEFYGYLRQVVVARIAVPEVVSATLVTPLRVRGQDTQVEWQIGRAAEAMISAGNNRRWRVDLAAHPTGYTFRVDESGPVRLEVRNRFGTVTANLGELTLYELPTYSVSLAGLPRPQVPSLEAVGVERMAAVLSSHRPRFDEAVISASHTMIDQLLGAARKHAAVPAATKPGDGT